MIIRPLSPKKHLGKQSEHQALRYLQSQGLSLICSNYGCRLGEIDLIMQHHLILVFVEVRFRSSSHFGTAPATVTTHKQRRIKLAAQHYLMRHRVDQHQACRFDVVGLSGPDLDNPEITWIQDAFS